MKLKYKHIIINKKNKQIESIEILKNNQFFLIGIEVTNSEIANILDINIDPQHTNSLPITSIEFCFNNQNNLLNLFKEKEKICFLTIRPDIDSIGSMAILTMLLNNDLQLDGDLILRLKAIAKSDRHSRDNWKRRREDFFQFHNYNIYGLPIGLLYLCSDYKLSMYSKVQNLIAYLKTGIFKDMEKYAELASNNMKYGIRSANIEIIIPETLALVRSIYSGAISAGYKVCPVVIAINDNYKFNNYKGRKVTIAQYTENEFIDMAKLLTNIRLIEQQWGGSDGIIASSQDSPSQLTDNQLIELVKKFLKK